MTGYNNRPGLTDHTRSYFWMYLESCVAVIMTSISAKKKSFGYAWKKANEKKGKKENPSRLWTRNGFCRKVKVVTESYGER